jgi:hypothetical protein
MTQNISLLNKIAILKNEHVNKSVKFINLFLKNIGNIYKNNDFLEPYNIILAASDIYYRENYHSDIIQYILNNKKDTIKYFINFINSLSDKVNIDVNNFLNTEVIREENKIDILIRDLTSKHCIIIENKIYNAGDMKRQLPRYYNKINKNGIVDGILYFSLDGLKRPDKSTWNNNDLQLGLDEKIVFGAASNETNLDFINNFLVKCMNNAKNIQENSFYNQYIDLIKFLRRNQMDYDLMEKFYNEMLVGEQYNSALSIRNMLNDLKTFRRDRIHNYYINNCEPFENIGTWSKNYTYFEYIRDISTKEFIKIDVICEENYSKIQFWIQDTKAKTDIIKIILENIGEDKSFKKEDENIYSKTFKFPTEDKKMYEYLTKLLSLLDKNKENIKI